MKPIDGSTGMDMARKSLGSGSSAWRLLRRLSLDTILAGLRCLVLGREVGVSAEPALIQFGSGMLTEDLWGRAG